MEIEQYNLERSTNPETVKAILEPLTPAERAEMAIRPLTRKMYSPGEWPDDIDHLTEWYLILREKEPAQIVLSKLMIEYPIYASDLLERVAEFELLESIPDHVYTPEEEKALDEIVKRATEKSLARIREMMKKD